MLPLAIGLGITGAGLLGKALVDYTENKRSKRQSKEMTKAIESAMPVIDVGYQQAMQEQQPYMQSGVEALNQYKGLLSAFSPSDFVTPDVGAFRYDKGVSDFLTPARDYEIKQAMDSILGNAAVSGLIKSGGTLKAMQDRGQQIAAQQYDTALQRMMQDRAQAYQQYMDRANYLSQLAQQRLQATQAKLGSLLNLANMGQQSSTGLGALASDRSASMANMMLGGAQSRAQGMTTGMLGSIGSMMQGLMPVGGYMLGGWAAKQ